MGVVVVRVSETQVGVVSVVLFDHAFPIFACALVRRTLGSFFVLLADAIGDQHVWSHCRVSLEIGRDLNKSIWPCSPPRLLLLLRD